MFTSCFLQNDIKTKLVENEFSQKLTAGESLRNLIYSIMNSVGGLSMKKIVLFMLAIQTVCLISNAGRIEISVGGIWPWKRFYTSSGTKCTDIGISLFDVPGINAATVESVLDGGNNCYSCTVYSKNNCAGTAFNLGCGSAIKLPSSVKRPESFKCVSRCSSCRKAQLAG